MNVWRGRINPDPQDQLLHQIIVPLDMTADLHSGTANQNFAILGFCSDEGVRRNFGRMGARLAPDSIRRISSGIAFHHAKEEIGVMDAGNVLCTGQNLEAAQQLLAGKVVKLVDLGVTPLILGGGHETSYGHFLGLHNVLGAEKLIGIINLDAHFDLRTYTNGGHSGSAFRQIADLVNDKFRYLPIGIRPESNVSSLSAFLKEHNQSYIGLDQLFTNFTKVLQRVNDFIDGVDAVYLTVDIDCFPSAYAPGASAAAPSGMLPYHAIELIKCIKSSGKALAYDIVEVNPTFDIDDRTLKLAAELMYHMMH